MKSYKLLADLTLDQKYSKGDIVTEETLGSYLNYFESIGVLEFISDPDSELEILKEEIKELEKEESEIAKDKEVLEELKEALPAKQEETKPMDFSKIIKKSK